MISGGSAGRGGAGRERQKRAVRFAVWVVQFLSRQEGGELTPDEEAVLVSQRLLETWTTDKNRRGRGVGVLQKELPSRLNQFVIGDAMDQGILIVEHSSRST